MTDDTRSTKSCGCVFCDLDLEPDNNGMHEGKTSDQSVMIPCPIYKKPMAHPLAFSVAQLRHMYSIMMWNKQKELANGLLSPAIQDIEKYMESQVEDQKPCVCFDMGKCDCGIGTVPIG